MNADSVSSLSAAFAGLDAGSLYRRAVKIAAPAFLPTSMLAVRGSRERPRIAITFDDGPVDLTRGYLDVLQRYRVRATFFLVGRLCAERPAEIAAIAERGHELGGHGYTHRPFAGMQRSELSAELERTAALLPEPPSGKRLVRPPHGSISVRSLVTCANAGFGTVLWSYDSQDSYAASAPYVERAFAANPVRAGDIILMHEGQAWTLHALPKVIEALREAGYEFFTVSELLDS